jgi:uncharacterized membrane protein YhaH (DUF805 family)
MLEPGCSMRAVGVSALTHFFFRPVGRIARREYALGAGVILSVSLAALSLLAARPGIATAFLLLLVVAGVAFLVAQLVLVAKRCHDIGLPGSYVLLLFVPLVGIAWLAALAIIPGTPGTNAYGPAPRFDEAA